MKLHRIAAVASVVPFLLGGFAFAQTSPQLGASAETPASQEPAPSPGEAQLPATPADGAVISQIQKRLAAEGYGPGTADGVWGPQTEAAVRNFQQDQDLNATGQLNQEPIAILLVPAESGSMEAAGDQGAADQQTQGGSSAGESSAAQSPSHGAQQQPQERR
jgi:peptidoglycan hydrolase-like protein with peptidoglycan-binding domain